MTHSDSPSDCLDRARMHDRLASSTDDPAARQMHQAMAAEFRRRAGLSADSAMPMPPQRGPIIEMQVPVG
ncbi:MAG TPA: hypothetical protein VF440_12945 [Novosphingobium sp.]